MVVTGVFAAVTLAPPCFFLENFYVTNKAAATYVSCVGKQMLGGTWELKLPVTQWWLRFIKIEKFPSVGMWSLAAAFFEEGGERNHSKPSQCPQTPHLAQTQQAEQLTGSTISMWLHSFGATAQLGFMAAFTGHHLWADTPWDTNCCCLWAGKVLQHTDRTSWLRIFWWRCTLALYFYEHHDCAKKIPLQIKWKQNDLVRPHRRQQGTPQKLGKNCSLQELLSGLGQTPSVSIWQPLDWCIRATRSQ